MTDDQILKQSLLKAQRNGFKWIGCFGNHGFIIDDYLKGHETLYCHTIGSYDGQISYDEIIFSHEFAKAFWGDVHLCGYCGKGFCYAYDCCSDNCQLGSNYPFPIKKWEYYLRKMVLEEEPIKYLEKFLDE